MPTPKKGYYLSDGSRVPSVTTVIGRFKDAGGLIHWAWKEGSEGRDYRETRDAAASVGTFAHAMVNAHIHNEPAKVIAMPGLTESQREHVYLAYQAFCEWWKGQAAGSEPATGQSIRRA